MLKVFESFKIGIIALLFVFPAITQAQNSNDTIYCKTVKVPYNVLRDKHTGEIIKVWYKTIKVETGYIIKTPDGSYAINDKTILPKYLKL